MSHEPISTHEFVVPHAEFEEIASPNDDGAAGHDLTVKLTVGSSVLANSIVRGDRTALIQSLLSAIFRKLDLVHARALPRGHLGAGQLSCEAMVYVLSNAGLVSALLLEEARSPADREKLRRRVSVGISDGI